MALVFGGSRFRFGKRKGISLTGRTITAGYSGVGVETWDRVLQVTWLIGDMRRRVKPERVLVY